MDRSIIDNLYAMCGFSRDVGIYIRLIDMRAVFGLEQACRDRSMKVGYS